MLSVQVLAMLLAGMICPATCAVDASAVLEEPIVVEIDRVGDGTLAEVDLVACVEVAQGDDETEHRIVVKAIRLGDEDDEGSATKACVVVARHAGGEIEPGGPWLGIRFGPVPKPLAAHLELDADVGQMVLNVVEESPADEAGLAQYDVIVKIDGEPVPSDVGVFLDLVRGMEPGETHAFTLIHEGRQTQIDLTVGERPEDFASAKSKYGEAVEEFMKQRVFRRGGLLEKDDEGSWRFKRFDLDDLPDVFEFFPDGNGFNFDLDLSGVFPHSQHHEFIWKSEKGGSTLRIESGDDGEIKVIRTKVEDGEKTTTTRTYADEEELKDGDLEAYEILHGESGCRIKILNRGGDKTILMTPGMRHGQHKFSLEDFDIDIDIDEVLEDAAEVRKNVAEVREYLEKRLGTRVRTLAKKFLLQQKARTSFEILDDGSVRVTTRRGGEELVESFKSAEAMEKTRPELYRKFMRLQSDGEDKTPKG